MLALHAAAGSDVPTLVFDEVDAGLGGRTGRAVGEVLARLARDRQVLVVTHLAQVAAFADHHLRVDKAEAGGRTVTRVAVLDGEDRIAELARMLAGDDGEAARRHARALLRDPAAFSEGWNFGPDAGGDQPVRVVVEKLAARWPDRLKWRVDDAEHPHEAGKLMLDSAKAHARLGWRPRLSLDDTIRLTADWYGRVLAGGEGLAEETEAQVRYHSALA